MSRSHSAHIRPYMHRSDHPLAAAVGQPVVSTGDRRHVWRISTVVLSAHNKNSLGVYRTHMHRNVHPLAPAFSPTYRRIFMNRSAHINNSPGAYPQSIRRIPTTPSARLQAHMHRNVHPLAPAHLSTYRRFPNERPAQIDGICTENGIQPLAAVLEERIILLWPRPARLRYAPSMRTAVSCRRQLPMTFLMRSASINGGVRRKALLHMHRNADGR